MKRLALFVALIGICGGACTPATEARMQARTTAVDSHTTNEGKPLPKTEEEWRKVLTPAQFHVLREKGTEPPFTGKYWNAHEEAVYLCAACGNALFDSDTKFESGTGWPSFHSPVHGAAVDTVEDRSHGMVRTEVTCSRCGGHLGHVFDDGPKPTGLRYCINSVCLRQEKK